jgi:imidazolonepropionase-like amidohydrolase
MGRSILTAALVALAGALASGAAAETTVFANANVVPMDVDGVLSDYTVVVEDDRIVAVGPAAEVEIPQGASVIDAAGGWLIPGLADMHAHLFADPNPDFMRTFLAEGVTTVRNLNTLPEAQTLAKEVAAGERIGPSIYNTGPVIDGLPPGSEMIVLGFKAIPAVGLLVLFLIALVVLRLARGRWAGWGAALGGSALAVAAGAGLVATHVIPLDALISPFFHDFNAVETPAEARAAVQRQAKDGYRMVKIYEFMGQGWLAAQKAAQEAGMYSISHLDSDVSLEDAVSSGMDEIAHVDELLDFILARKMDLDHFDPIPVNEAKLQKVIDTVAGHDLMVVSNMVVDENAIDYLEAGPSYFDRPEYKVIRPETVAQWRKSRVVHWQGQQDYRREVQPYFAALVKGLHDAGVPILTGTDVGVEGITPSHIHREIELLVEAGLSRYEALRAATVNANDSLRRTGFDVNVGTVTPGASADLVLLRANPLTTPDATRDRVGVMSQGRWRTQGELDKLTAELTTSY